MVLVIPRFSLPLPAAGGGRREQHSVSVYLRVSAPPCVPSSGPPSPPSLYPGGVSVFLRGLKNGVFATVAFTR